jgi:hypothetical protein
MIEKRNVMTEGRRGKKGEEITKEEKKGLEREVLLSRSWGTSLIGTCCSCIHEIT